MSIVNNQQFTLTDNQELALDEIKSFLTSETNCFLLKGYAGTGKTFLMGILIDYLDTIKRPYVVMAPTGRASMIIGQKTKSDSSTIHRAIYDFDRLVDKPTTFKFGYELAINNNSISTVYIVDEASMISDVHNEDEFFTFGSGFLLQDLITFTGITSNSQSKLIFVGDNAQLPPVNMNFSPALNADYLKEEYDIIVQEAELTEVVRQQNDTPVLNLATQIRKSIELNQYNRFELPQHQADIAILKSSDFLSKYLSQHPDFPNGESVVITYSNKRASEYNKVIRNHYHGSDCPVREGDMIIFTRNNYNYEVDLLNGMFARIIAVSDKTEERSTTFIVKNNQKVTIKHRFRDVVVEVNKDLNSVISIRCKVIDQFLDSPNARLHPYEQRALYIDFKNRYSHLKPGTKEFKDKLKSDLYFNALQTKYGYAITCHKAQGGEWNKVFIDFNVSLGLLTKSFFRWAYTAVTRSRKQIFAIDAKQYVPLSQFIVRNIEKLGGIDTSMYYRPPITISETDDEIYKTFPFLKARLNEIVNNLENQEIKYSVVHKNYQETFTFSRGSEVYTIGLSYNKKGFNGYVQEITKTGEELSIFIKNVVLQQFIYPVEYMGNSDYQKDLFDLIQEKADELEIPITNIVYQQFCDRYYFKTDAECAYIDFWYDGKGIYTKFLPKSTLGEADEKLQKLLTNIT